MLGLNNGIGVYCVYMKLRVCSDFIRVSDMFYAMQTDDCKKGMHEKE